MTFQGVIILDLIGIMLLFWILHLIRSDRLYVGYGVVFVVATIVTIVIISFKELLIIVTRIVGTVFPASALTVLALGFMTFMLIYIFGQLTVISNRLARVVQELAIEKAKQDKEHGL
jgi:hypothetical protein